MDNAVALVHTPVAHVRSLLQSAAFRDPVLDLLKLSGKLGMELRVPR